MRRDEIVEVVEVRPLTLAGAHGERDEGPTPEPAGQQQPVRA